MPLGIHSTFLESINAILDSIPLYIFTDVVLLKLSNSYEIWILSPPSFKGGNWDQRCSIICSIQVLLIQGSIPLLLLTRTDMALKRCYPCWPHLALMACHSAQDTDHCATLQTHVAFCWPEINTGEHLGKYSLSFRFHWYTCSHPLMHFRSKSSQIRFCSWGIYLFSLIWETSNASLEVWTGIKLAHSIWCVRQKGQTPHPEAGKQCVIFTRVAAIFFLQLVANNTFGGQGSDAYISFHPSIPWEEQIFPGSWESILLKRRKGETISLKKMMFSPF